MTAPLIVWLITIVVTVAVLIVWVLDVRDGWSRRWSRRRAWAMQAWEWLKDRRPRLDEAQQYLANRKRSVTRDEPHGRDDL